MHHFSRIRDRQIYKLEIYNFCKNYNFVILFPSAPTPTLHQLQHYRTSEKERGHRSARLNACTGFLGNKCIFLFLMSDISIPTTFRERGRGAKYTYFPRNPCEHWEGLSGAPAPSLRWANAEAGASLRRVQKKLIQKMVLNP